MSYGTVIPQKYFYKIECKPLPKLIAAIKELPERKFDYNNKIWTVPLQYRDEVERFAKVNNLTFGYVHQEEDSQNFTIEPLPELEIDIPLKRELRPYQRGGVAYSMSRQRLIMGDDMGLGKEQPLYSKILTPNGWVTMGDIQVGDYVIGLDGKKTKVCGVFPQGIKPIYRVHFSDDSNTDCGLEHLWRVRNCRHENWEILNLSQIISKPLKQKKKGGKGAYLWEVPIVEPVEYNSNTNLPLHPYLLGFLLGNGNFSNNSVRISFPDDESAENLINTLPKGVVMNKSDEYYWCISNISGLRRKDSNIVMKELSKLGLRGETTFNKFIPEMYMTASIEDRLSLLRGLLDSDGHAKENGSAEFDNGSEKLINQIIELVQSLGGIANTSNVPDSRGTGDIFRVYISLSGNLNPFLLSRKAKRYKTESQRTRKVKRKIVKVEYIGDFEAKCISVDSESHCYVTDNYIVTHNTTQAIVTIAGLSQLNKASFPCLIICPSAVKENWKREIEVVTNYKAIVLTDSIKNTFMEYYRVGLCHFFITNYESLKKYFVESIDDPGESNGRKKPLRLNHIHFKQKYVEFFKAVIIDESHKVKSITTKNTKFTKGICNGKETILALTGTPVVNKPKDLVSQLGILGRMQDFGGWKNFEARYCSGPKEASNLKELNYQLNNICFYRRNKTDPEIKKYLPDKSRQVIMCDLNTESRKEYNHARANLESYMKQYKEASDEQIQKSMKGEVMVRIGILKNISARGKLKDAFDFISDIIESGQKIVVFASLKEVIAAVQQRFPRSVRVTGAEDGLQKQASVDAFRNNPNVDLIVLNLKAGGTGVDGLQAVATQICFIEFGWHAAIMDQAEDRLYRMGQHSNVMCTYFLGKDTIDEWNYKLINSKREIANTVTGNEDLTEVSIIDSVMNLFDTK